MLFDDFLRDYQLLIEVNRKTVDAVAGMGIK